MVLESTGIRRAGAWRQCGSVLAAGLALVLGITAVAQEPLASGSGPIDVKADKLEYDRGRSRVYARGHVVVTRGGEELRADYMEIDTDAEVARAEGNVLLKRDGETWHFEELNYDFKGKRGDVKGISGATEPFKVQAERTEMLESLYILHDARVTTCVNAYPHTHYHLRAKQITVLPQRHMKARGAVLYFGRVPSLYVPYWYRDLREGYGWRLRPGYDSRMGAYLLSGYYYPISDVFRGETHLDTRTRRGLAVGQDIRWSDPERRRWFGELQAYYAADQNPVDDDEDAATSDIDSNRWRMLIRHNYNASLRDYIMLQGQWLSDTDILEDFFDREYRRSSQPDNYAVLTHRGEAYTAGLLFRARLNDFYSQVERLPEASFSVLRQELAGSGVYYESQNSAAYLRQSWDDNLGWEDYAAFRIDSANMLYRPFKAYGFLNLVPRAGYRGTYYSVTLDEQGEERGGALRSRFELGQEVSFKAFKAWEGPAGPLRHIVEPYVNYTYIPEPDVRPEELYYFDYIDGLDREHAVLLGVRNKLQTKRDERPCDLVDADVFTVYKIERGPEEEPVEDIFMDTELRPYEAVRIDLDGVFNLPDRELTTFNTQVGYRHSDWLDCWMEHRFRRDVSSLLSGGCTLFETRPWGFGGYGRYEMEESRLEEIGGFVQRNLDCLAIRTGFSALPGYIRSDGSQREDEWRIGLEIWLTAFPEQRMGGKMGM